MFWRRLSIFFLCTVAFAIPIEHKYDKLFRLFSLKLIPPNVVLPSFFEKKIYFYPSDILALGLLCIAVFALRIPVRRFFIFRGAIFLWIVFLLSLISIVLSPLAQYPIPYIRLLQLATPFLLFCFLSNACADEEKSKLSSLIIGCVALAALVQSGIAIAQYAMQGPLGLRLLGEINGFSLFHVASGRKWLFDFANIYAPATIIRASGTFPHANVLGGFLSISMLALYSFFSMPRWRLLSALLIPIQFFAMSLTFSRSALFSWMLGTLVWFGLQMKKNGFRTTVRDPGIRLLFSSICVSFVFSFAVLYEQISQRGGIVNYNLTAQGSDAQRIQFQNVALEIIKDHPLHGTGFQQLSVRSIDYVRNNPNYFQSGATHNIYLYLAAETGLFSLAAFLFFILSLLWAALKSPGNPHLASLTAIFIAFLFIGGCDFYPLLFQQGKIPFFLAAGLLALNSRWHRAPILQETA